MVFSYYRRLSARQKKTYRNSDSVTSVPLPDAPALHPQVLALTAELAACRQQQIATACAGIATGVTGQLRIGPVRVKVLAARPHNDYGELHGLYEPGQGGARPVITLWMRTARQKRVVAFRSFLRTLLHELCHHIDYEMLELPDSFHTKGFYQRESSLFHQLVTHNEALREQPPAGTDGHR